MKKLAIIFSFFVVACGSKTGHVETTDISKATDMMESVFEGPYSASSINSKMTELLKAYKMEVNEDNLMKAGNELILLKKKSGNGITEMEIASAMLEASDGNLSLSFFEQASKTAETLIREKEIAGRLIQ